ncbi:hypothetical protein A3K82_00250 [Candidatus Pacearchaeota archaeon RBG_19FT_COMBO_34_9]|nr:MAG: hypothetical protein A3K82_00250 [Candidatus Pacearchaeota archaeon RBG_19FT_COMBO_34_9]
MPENTQRKISILNGKIKQFKRKAIGFFGKEAVKSLDELAGILCDLEVVYNKKEAIEFIQKLYHVGGGLPYNNSYNIIFSDCRGKNRIWGEACRVELSPLYPLPFRNPKERENYFEDRY